MADPKRVGRVFCVTGTQQEESMFLNSQTKTNLGHSDTESNSSGYVSSSSFEYSGEDKRIVPNEHKVFQMWERWGQHAQVPKSSTPKDTSVRRITGSTENLLCIRKTLGKSSSQQKDTKTDCDSFWDIEVPDRLKACSVSDKNTSERPSSVPLNKRHDAGSDIPLRRSSDGDRKTCSSNDWRRKPFLTVSNSDSDLRTCGKTRQHSGSSTNSSNSEYNCLPRYRVKVDTDVSSNVAKQLTKSSRDFCDEGVSVDESMTEFLSSVDKDNLAGILQFYDHVTSESAYRNTRNSKPRYESVYF